MCLPRLCVLRALKRQREKKNIKNQWGGAETNREERMRNKSVDRQGEWPISGRPPPSPPLAAGSWRSMLNLATQAQIQKSLALLNMVKATRLALWPNG